MAFTAEFVHAGGMVDYTPSADVAAGAVVVQGALVGVAPRAIAANTLGALQVEGVFDFPKATGVGEGISAGALSYWNATAQQATTSASGNTLLGKCVQAAGDNDATVRIKLDP